MKGNNEMYQNKL